MDGKFGEDTAFSLAYQVCRTKYSPRQSRGLGCGLGCHDEVNQQFFEQKAENPQTQNQKQDKHAKLTRFGFFAQIPNDEAEKDDEYRQANFQRP